MSKFTFIQRIVKSEILNDITKRKDCIQSISDIHIDPENNIIYIINKENSELIYLTSHEKEALSFTTYETIISLFFPFFMSKETKAKVALLKEGKNNLLKYIDIYQMVKQFQELQNLKMVLLKKM